MYNTQVQNRREGINAVIVYMCLHSNVLFTTVPVCECLDFEYREVSGDIPAPQYTQSHRV